MNIGTWLPPASTTHPCPLAASAWPVPNLRAAWRGGGVEGRRRGGVVAWPEQFCSPPVVLPGPSREVAGWATRHSPLVPTAWAWTWGAVCSRKGQPRASPLLPLPSCRLRAGNEGSQPFGGLSTLWSARGAWGAGRSASVRGHWAASASGLWGWEQAPKWPSRCVSAEPAILVMHHSMKPHPAITATLLDFMCRVRVLALRAQLPGRACAPWTSGLQRGLPLPSAYGRRGRGPPRPGVLPPCPTVSSGPWPAVHVSAGFLGLRDDYLIVSAPGGAAGPRFNSLEWAGTFRSFPWSYPRVL